MRRYLSILFATLNMFLHVYGQEDIIYKSCCTCNFPLRNGTIDTTQVYLSTNFVFEESFKSTDVSIYSVLDSNRHLIYSKKITSNRSSGVADFFDVKNENLEYFEVIIDEQVIRLSINRKYRTILIKYDSDYKKAYITYCNGILYYY